MIEITLTDTEYNEFVFDNVTQQTVGADRLESAAGLVSELSDPVKTETRPLSLAEREKAAQVGRKLWPSRKLAMPRATFTLHLDEHALLQALLENAVSRHPLLVLPEYMILLAKVRDAGPLADDGEDDAGSDTG